MDEVYNFAARWPCFGRTGAMSFTFDRDSGDLVALSTPAGEQDDSGVAALADDAKAYAAKRLGLNW